VNGFTAISGSLVPLVLHCPVFVSVLGNTLFRQKIFENHFNPIFFLVFVSTVTGLVTSGQPEPGLFVSTPPISLKAFSSCAGVNWGYTPAIPLQFFQHK
jgi:hypothetical protein